MTPGCERGVALVVALLAMLVMVALGAGLMLAAALQNSEKFATWLPWILLINISGLIGTVLGAYIGGALTDKVAEWKARKNNGIYEPEFRLLILIIPFFVLPFGLLMYSLKWLPLTFRYGIGVERQTHWIVPYIGFGGIHLGFAAVNAITMAYSTFSGTRSPRFAGPECATSS